MLHERNSGWYTAHLELEEGQFFGKKGFAAGISGLFTLFFFWRLLLLPSCRVLRHLPASLPRVLELRQTRESDSERLREIFKERCANLLAPSGCNYVGVPLILLEVVVSLLILLGMLCSFTKPDYSWISQSTGHGDSPLTSVEYIVKHSAGLQLLVELLYDCFFDETTFHGLGWLLLYFHTFFMTIQDVRGLKWLGQTLLLATGRMAYFTVFYFFLIFGFGVVIWIQFGARFVQFNTLNRVTLELLLIAFGFEAHAFDDIYPFEDNISKMAGIYLATFLLLAVTISLNFFTTILLDAYMLAMDHAQADKLVEQRKEELVSLAMAVAGIAPPHQKWTMDVELELCQVPTSRDLRASESLIQPPT